MKGHLLRMWFMVAILGFIIAGWLMFGIAKPEILFFLSPETAKNFANGAVSPVVFALGGMVLILVAILMFTLIAPNGTFSKSLTNPKAVNRLKAQGLAVFLVDKEVYVKDTATFYNMTDLNDIRIVVKRNLFYSVIGTDIVIANDTVPTVTEEKNVEFVDAKSFTYNPNKEKYDG